MLAPNDRAYRNRDVNNIIINGRSDGVIHDFAGPYYISVDNFAFGRPLKYIKINYKNGKSWDEAIILSDNKFKKTMHNICW
jgi:hypothetical protein